MYPRDVRYPRCSVDRIDKSIFGVVNRVGYGSYEKRTTFDKMREFEEYGYVTHECPNCGDECEPTEIDSDTAYCAGCDEVIVIEALA